MNYDYVVIGSGISGLASATILAQDGYRVAVLEKSPLMAPILRGFSRQGILFDTGFHYAGGLGDGEILDLFFRFMGVADRLEKYSFLSDHFDVFRDIEGKGEFRFPIGYESLREELCSVFPRERGAIDNYLGAVKNACNALPYLNLDVDFGVGRALGNVQGPSLAEFLDRLTPNNALKQLLSLHSLLYGVPADEVPFSFHAGVVGGYYQSVTGLKGGGLSLVEAFEARLEELGIDFFAGNAAKRLRVASNGRLIGVETEQGELFSCHGCVSTVHPRAFLDLVSPELLRPVYRRRLQQLDETVSAFILYGACATPAPLLQGANLFLGRFDSSSKDLIRGELEDRTLYLAGTAPQGDDPGGMGFVAICPAEQESTARWAESSRGRRPADYLRFKEQTMERLQRHIERCCPELRGGFRVVEGATPLTIGDYAASPGAGLYGAKHKVGQYNPMPATRIPGVFLSGQGVAAPGVLGGVLSGFLTCGHILGHTRLRKGLKKCS